MRLTFVIGLVLFGVFAEATEPGAAVREPVVAGSFYPADSGRLGQMVSSHLNGVSDLPTIDGQIIALVVPHAGLIYSGQIAAHAYKLLENSGVNKVILCGPSHRYGFDGLSVYGPGMIWKTPLGRVKCSDSLCNALLKLSPSIDVIAEAHAGEHALEVQLPYLQSVLGDFEIVPIVMGYQNSEAINLLSEALSKLAFDDRTVMVAATDWQHYRPASEGWKMDSLGVACIENLDPSRLEKFLAGGQVEACGGGPTVAVLKAAKAKGANKVKVLRYGDSGDVSGDKASVVGYVAAVLYKSSTGKSSLRQSDSVKQPTPTALPEKFQLSESDKTTLLSIARQSISQHLSKGTLPEFEVSDNLRQPGAAFVTLTKQGRLRGCIGHTVAQEPLYKTVAVCAVQAAVADSRFPPVPPDELEQLHIEISVLTPLQTVRQLNEIEVGRDGLMITLGDKRGLLLPQVATDYGWNRTQFLEQTCHKAGLPADAYKSSSASIQRFQAVVFGERER
ncbi:MAG TPA: AmmeMemoRadiSam system protein B [Candidatus Deferrimicrobium sp.]|nr:AmmeMemoRadiSam system protein B [Candidatus Deferrimicrobium sp.]